MNPFHTEHIEVNPRQCEACGRCVEACREDALCIVGFLFHKHVKVRAADRCRGCLRCVKACEHGAIRALRPRRRTGPTAGAPVLPEPSRARDEDGKPLEQLPAMLAERLERPGT